MEVVDGLLISIHGSPEVLLVLSHLCGQGAVSNSRLSDASTGKAIEVIPMA